MFLLAPFDEVVPSFQPTIERVKQVIVPFGTSPGQATKYFFPQDDEINNSIVKGIRYEPADFPIRFPGPVRTPGTISIPPVTVNYIDYYAALRIVVNLVKNPYIKSNSNKKDKVTTRSRPLVSLAGYRDPNFLTVNPNTFDIRPRVTQRYNARFEWTKCWLQWTPDSTPTPVVNSAVILSVTYLPIPC